MTHHDDPPLATLRLLYSAAAWAVLGLLTLVLLWLLGTMFALASVGTAESQALAVVRPTVTAIAAEYVGAEGTGVAAPVKVDLPATCAACHALAGTSAKGTTGPDLTHMGSVAARMIASSDYTGKATSVVDYIRESILDPNAYVVPGDTYGRPGASTMPADTSLSPQELKKLVAYLASLQ